MQSEASIRAEIFKEKVAASEDEIERI